MQAVFNLFFVCSLSLLSYSQLLYNTDQPSPNIPCSQPACYQKLYVPDATNMVPQARDGRFHITDVYSFKELCSTTNHTLFNAYNITKNSFTCIDYFCNANSPTLIQQVLTQPQIQYIPTVYQGSPNLQAWWAPHFDIRNYCYYCNHAHHNDFIARVNNYTCPYFWKHSTSYGNDGKNPTENPTLLFTIHQGYINLNADKLSNRDPTNNITDFLYLTSLRTSLKGEIGEENRYEFPYYIYCSSWNKFGTKCDAYIYLINPIRYQVWPILDIIVRVSIALLYIFLLWIPRVNFHSKNHLRGIRSVHKFLYEICSDLKIQCITYMTLAIMFIILEDISDNKVAETTFDNIRGIFRILSVLCTTLGLLVLLVFWSHIYHSSSSMGDTDNLNIWNKVALGVFYLCVGTVTVISFILYLTILDRRNLHRYLFLVAIIFYLLLFVGFFIYGLRMFYMLRKHNSVNFLKLKFTKFMMVIMVLFLHFIAWMVIMMIEFGETAGKMGLFISLMRGPLLDLSCMLMYPLVLYMLFEKIKFWAFGPYEKTFQLVKKCFTRRKQDEVHVDTEYNLLETNE